MSPQDLADHFLNLEKCGCANINWVTPTPQLPLALEALAMAMQRGLKLPLVYNTNGYLKSKILKFLDGIVDIYLPDFKYGEDIWAEQFSGFQDYFSIAGDAIEEMHRQVGCLSVDKAGLAVKGILVRHLILPNGIAGSGKIFRRLAAIDPNIAVSLMAQYRPQYRAISDPLINRPVLIQEYKNAIEQFINSGLTNGYFQNLNDLMVEDGFFPDFNSSSDSIFS